MAKKTTKKESLESKVEKELEIMENSNDKIESTAINADIGVVIDSVKSVDVELKSDSEEKIQEMAEKFSEALDPIKKISEKVSQITDMESLDEKINKAAPNEMQAIIQQEIENTKELIKKVEEIKNNSKTHFTSVTNWWNGMGYDF